MRLITFSVLVVTLWTTAAFADPGRRGGGGFNSRRPAVRDHRSYNRPVYQSQPQVRNQRSGGYTGTVRADRRVVNRRPLYQRGGTFTFYGGATVDYRRPVIRDRHYDVNIRPQVFVENYPSQPGYVWVNGSWSWNGYEWAWVDGYYSPDPSYSNYYDDGSYQ